MKVGWNVGEVFNMIYLAHGGEFFQPGSAAPAINNEKAIAALNVMKSLTEYAHPDHLTPGFERNPGALGSRSGSAWRHVGVRVVV